MAITTHLISSNGLRRCLFYMYFKVYCFHLNKAKVLYQHLIYFDKEDGVWDALFKSCI